MSSSEGLTESDQTLNKLEQEAQQLIQERLSAFYSSGVPVVNVFVVLSFFANMKLYNQVSFTSPWAIMYLACLVLSFLTDMEMNRMFVTWQFRRRWMMAYLSTFLQILAATALMLFFHKASIVTVIPLFCLVFVLVLAIHLFRRTLSTIEPGLNWIRLKDSLEREFELSALVVAPSVAGLSGKVLGYVQVDGSASNLTAGGHGFTALAPECFLFCSAICSLLVLLLCTVPPSLGSREYVKKMAKVHIPRITYAALLFLVMATVVAADKILQENVCFVCCPIVILAALLFLWDAAAPSGLPIREPPSLDDEWKEEANRSKYLLKAGISSILLAIMAIHSSYGVIGSTVSLSWSWKAFVVLAVWSILSHTVRILILGQMTETKRYKISRTVWTKGTSLTIIATVVFAVLVICLHQDEFINIF